MNELANLPLAFWIVAPVTLFVAYFVFGLSGFGSTVLSLPILALWLPLTYLVPLMTVGDMLASLLMGTRHREQVSRAELKRLLPFMLLGILLGATLLVNVPQPPLKVGLGCFAIAVGVHSIANPSPRGTISPWWCVPAGTVAGVLGAVFGAGGPVNVAYLSGRLHDKGEVRSTISVVISVSSTVRTVLYAVGGLVLKASLLAGIALAAPFALAGMRAGARVHTNLSQRQMRLAIGSLLVVSGGLLLAKTLLA